MMNRINTLAGEGVGVWCILSPEYGLNDIPNLTTQLSLQFPVDIADFNLGRKWNELGTIYSMADVNEIIFIVNKEGRVLYTFGQNYIRSQTEFINRCLELSGGKVYEN